MPDLVEALHNLARQRGRGDASPLITLREFPERAGSRISHLPISQRLIQAWVTITGEPFRQHQSLSLAAMRRGEPFALVGGGPAARQTLHLLAFEALRSDPHATALLLAPDDDSLALHQGEMERLNKALAQPLTVAVASGDQARAAMSARAVIATPATFHDRLLARHDRAWRNLWSGLRLLLVADAHRYDGVAAQHLAALLLRAERLAPTPPPPLLGATVAAVAGAETALAQISPRPWRLIGLEDAPRPAVALALWRAGGDRMREATALALGLQQARATVHVTCTPMEQRPLQALIGADVAAISVGSGVLSAQAQILIGAGVGGAALREAIESGAQLVVLLLGDEPAERTIARIAGRDPRGLPLLDDGPPVWIAPPLNAYVAAQHLLCAASEQPISAAEVQAWGYESIIDRLEDRGDLIRLPEATPGWQPMPGGDDPYEGFGLRTTGGPPALICDEQGQLLGELDPAAFDRWAFVGAALPPLRGGFRVVGRDEESLSVTVRMGGELRRTLPLRRCAVRVRDTRERRAVSGYEVGWGRVVVEEEIYGYRELVGNNAPAERALAAPLSGSWSAPALWIDLAAPIASSGQLVGWSLAAALPLRTLCAPSDCVPIYDPEARRIFLIDAQPGGNGLAGWLFDRLEELLPLAYDVALDCRGDPLLEPVARADMDWLLALLSKRHGDKEAEASLRLRSSQERQEEIPLPPPPPAPAPLPLRSAPVPTPPKEPPQVVPAQPPLPLSAPSESRQDALKQATTPRQRRRSGRETQRPAEPPPPVRRSEPPPPEPPARATRRPEPAPPPPPPEPPARAARRPEPAPPPPPPEPALPDAAAMVARLRKLREQRERREPTRTPVRRTTQSGGEPRFQAGDIIHCTPYGEGEVISSRIEGDRELLTVDFPEHGELTVDAAVSAARLVHSTDPAEDPPF